MRRKYIAISQLLLLPLLHLMPCLMFHYKISCTELKKRVHPFVGVSTYSTTLGSHSLFLFTWVTPALRVIFLGDRSPGDIKQKSDIFSLTRRKEKITIIFQSSHSESSHSIKGKLRDRFLANFTLDSVGYLSQMNNTCISEEHNFKRTWHLQSSFCWWKE